MTFISDTLEIYACELQSYADFVLEDLCKHYGIEASNREERIDALLEHFKLQLQNKEL